MPTRQEWDDLCFQLADAEAELGEYKAAIEAIRTIVEEESTCTEDIVATVRALSERSKA